MFFFQAPDKSTHLFRVVCGSDGVKRVVWLEVKVGVLYFGCYVEEGAFLGYHFIPIAYCKVVYGCIGSP